MKPLPWIDAHQITTTVSLADAITALRAAFTAGPEHIARAAYPAAGGEMLVMPAVDHAAAGVKLLMVQPANAARGVPVIQGTYVLFDATAGRPVALLDGAALTALRTPAVSAVATAALARDAITTLGIIGAGPQAISHVAAMLAVRPGIESITVASRSAASAAACVESIERGATAGGRRVRFGTFADAAAADIVCTVTRAVEPLVDQGMLSAGAHINAVGAYRADMRELAADVIASSTVVVDELHAAEHEAGDLILAVAAGAWSWHRLAGDLADVCAGRVARRSDNETTVFKSVGLAVEDLVVARLVASRLELL